MKLCFWNPIGMIHTPKNDSGIPQSVRSTEGGIRSKDCVYLIRFDFDFMNLYAEVLDGLTKMELGGNFL